jgi:hypothetical protein
MCGQMWTVYMFPLRKTTFSREIYTDCPQPSTNGYGVGKKRLTCGHFQKNQKGMKHERNLRA